MFDKGIFTSEVKRLHLISDEECAYFDALEDATAEAFADEVFDLADSVKLTIKQNCKNQSEDIARFKLVLKQIDENYVGHTLFKLLQTKLHFTVVQTNALIGQNTKIRIAHDNTNARPDRGSAFFPEQLAVAVKFLYYDDDGAGLSDRQYYVMDLSAPKDDQVTTRKKSLVGSIFHELTHALHWISKTSCNEKTNIIWKSMEERYTISGYRKKHGHDVICDYGFEKYNSIMPQNPALGRDGKFCPRFGHQRCVLSVNEYLSSCPNNLLNKITLNIARANSNIVGFIP